MFVHKTNFLMRALYPRFCWKMPSDERKIYLTFDDGPIPEITEFVLETLDKYQAKATFFCIGDNIFKNPSIFNQLLKQGHSIGNHTYNHLNGWKTDTQTYLSNIEQCQETIEKNISEKLPKKLFRPPYGRIKPKQSKLLIPDYQIIMWDVLTGDFSQNLNYETILRKTLRYTESGSIVLFHDSIKANKNMSFVLPRFLDHFSEKGFQFCKI